MKICLRKAVSKSYNIKIFYLLTCIMISLNLKAQLNCGTTTKQGEQVTTFRSADPNCRKSVDVNIHFVLRGNGTGNFTETTDPNGSTSDNGYIFAQDIVDGTNSEWNDNQAAWLPKPNSYPVNDINIQFNLKGIFFIRNTNLYNASPGNFSSFLPYQVNPNTEMNIFFIGEKTYDGIASGIPAQVGRLVAKVHDTNIKFDQGGYRGWGYSVLQRTFAHEIGHLFGLRHPRNGDSCADTHNPNPCYQHVSNPTSPCNNWNNITNTFMNYNPYQAAISACQIEIMHENLDNLFFDYYTDVNQTSADFFIPTTQFGCNGTVSSSGVYFNDNSTNVDEWKIEIWKTNYFCSSNNLGNYWSSGWQSGNPYSYLSSIYNFSTNSTYRVTYSTKNDCGYEDQKSACVYIQEICFGFRYTVSPNPSVNEIFIDYNLEESSDLSLSIIGGSNVDLEKVVLDKKKHPKGEYKECVDISNLKSGVYFIKAKLNKKVFLEKFIIQKNH